MLETKDAYKVLGLKEGAGRNEVEKRFTILLKKHRMAVSGEIDDENARNMDINEITKAYNFLMGYEVEPDKEDIITRPNPLLVKMGIDEKKARNFLYYYKYHIVIGIVVLLTLILTLRSCVMRVTPDLNVVFIGAINYSDSDSFKQAVKAVIPEIKEVGIDGALLIEGGDAQYEYAMQMKAMTLFAAADVDVMILDRVQFEKYAPMGAFMKLDDIIDISEIDEDRYSKCFFKTEEDQEEHLYGVDVSSSAILEDSGITGNEKIAAISTRAKNVEKAIKLVEMLLE